MQQENHKLPRAFAMATNAPLEPIDSNTCHSSLYISDNKESIISCQHMITYTILITTMVSIERHYVLFPKTAFF